MLGRQAANRRTERAAQPAPASPELVRQIRARVQPQHRPSQNVSEAEQLPSHAFPRCDPRYGTVQHFCQLPPGRAEQLMIGPLEFIDLRAEFSVASL